MQSQSNIANNQSSFSSPNREKSDTMFKRLNKLANTKLKGFVGGKQLISLDIQSHSSTTSQILSINSQSSHTFTARERYLNTINRKPPVETLPNNTKTVKNYTNSDVLRRHQPVVNFKSKMVESSNKVLNQIRNEREASRTKAALKDHEILENQRRNRMEREDRYSNLNLAEESENRKK